MRTLVAEWWEVWFVPPYGQPLRHDCDDGVPVNPHVPTFGFTTRAEARERVRRLRNKYMRIKHVRRFKVTLCATSTA